MRRVLVLDNHKRPLMPCHPARAREQLRKGKAAVYRHEPFTILLKHREGGAVQPIELKADPGSKISGITLVADTDRGKRVVWAANLRHRGQVVKTALDARRALRRGRRHRKNRHRASRFDNRARPHGWLPPSLLSRVANVEHWTCKLTHLAPVSDIAVETVRFDTQILQNPNIEDIEYQQGTLYGTELREYLLYRYGHMCAYCGGLSGDPILEREHIQPRSLGGSDRASNQAIACRSCNEAKGYKPPKKAWLAELQGSRSKLNQIRAKRFSKIVAGVRPALKDAAAVNTTRFEIGRRLKNSGLPTTFWSGGRTKWNRTEQGYEKDHWIDAACVGKSGAAVFIPKTLYPLQIHATGRGSRQMCRPDKYGFPRTAAKSVKRIHGYQTGDLVRLIQPRGKYAGTYIGKVSVRERGDFDLSTVINGKVVKITSKYTNFIQLQRSDGYAYAA